MSNVLTIELKPGNVAPRYSKETKQLTINRAVITEEGMANGKPLVDFQIEDDEGNEYFIMITGSILKTLGHTIEGVQQRTGK